MAIAEPPERPGTRRAIVLVGIVAVLVLAGWAYLRPGAGPIVTASSSGGATVPAVVPPPPAPPQSPATTLPAASPPAAGPSFDVVRVGPDGNAVIAGRAAPGTEVVVRDGTQEIARTQADRQGSFVAVPAAPLAPGGRALTLASRDAGGETRGDGSVMVVVPPVASAPVPAPVPAPGPTSGPTSGPERPGATAVLVPDSGAPRVLQGARKPGGLGLDAVDYDDKGGIRFTGHAEGGSLLRVYVDNKPVGDAGASAAGTWVLTPGDAVPPGVHALRVDRLDPAGRVLSRVELPFQRATLPASDLAGIAGGRIVVQPGQNLWRMARAAYGAGVRYTVIYLANREQIRDPRLIYPGQAFSMPENAR